MMRRLVFVLVCLLVGTAHAQDVYLIHGRILKEDLSEFQQPLGLSVLAKRAGDPSPIRGRTRGSAYQIVIPADRAVEGSIWTIEFEERTRHPGSISDISGPPTGVAPAKSWVHRVDKVLLPEDGPRGFERNIEQLLEYERIWYDRIGSGMTVPQLNQQYGFKLRQLPDMNNRGALPELFGNSEASRRRRSLLWKKRWEVFCLYGMRPPEWGG